MPTKPYLGGSVFEPVATDAMSVAFGDVCQALNLPDKAKGAREVIATRILELVRQGERDPDRLRDRVLKEAKSNSTSRIIS